MSKNPYFLPEINPKNYALQLLADTIGIEQIPIDVFAIPEFLEEYSVTLEFSKDKFTDSTEYGVTELFSDDTKRIYLNANFYGNSFDEVMQDKVKRSHCRFTLAHELGHCTIPTHKNYDLQHDLLVSSNIHAKRYSFMKEYEASVFAAELLIPSNTIQNIYEYGTTFKEIINNVSDKYDTSLTASAFKAASLMTDSICICLMINPLKNEIIKVEYSQAFADYP
jgi:Zn-dependent peptidase ImmA (M78 family)